MTRNALIACGLVKRHILFSVTAEAIGRQMPGIATPYGWHVFMSVCALQWMVAGRMAVHAARMRQQLSDFAENARERSVALEIDMNSEGPLRF